MDAESGPIVLIVLYITEATKDTQGDVKCVMEILGGGGKIRKLGWQNFTFLFRGKIIALIRLNGQ